VKSEYTPYEILYRLLAGKKFPKKYCDYEIIYDKTTAECDIILKFEDIQDDKRSVYHIDRKIAVMNKLINELQKIKPIIPTRYKEIKQISVIGVQSLF